MRGVAIALGVMLMGAASAWAASAPSPTVTTSRGCYVVGQVVRFTGSGFAARRTYDVTLDGVDFGRAQTDSSGGVSAHLLPGGLPAGVPQSVDRLDVSDGTSDAGTQFTVTRTAGARFLASRGNPRTLSAPFQVWGFSLDGAPREVYLHYVAPSGRQRRTVRLGRVGGQCGYLVTRRLRVFPFSPSTGTWTLQVDAHAAYSGRPGGPVWRIYVRIARG